jgi:hypothetical protein
MKADDPSSSKDTAGTPGEGANPESPQKEEPLFSAAGAAKTANKAIDETARKYLAAQLTALGHEVRLMSPALVMPYRKGNKTDRNDAEAILEAVTRPSMRFVTEWGRALTSAEMLDSRAERDSG